MNANELANELMKCSIPRLFYLDELMNNAAIMLRQQQAEIEALKAENSHLKYEISSGAWNPVPLTDEELCKRKKGIKKMNIEEIKDSLQTNNFVGLRARLDSAIEFIDRQQAEIEALKADNKKAYAYIARLANEMEKAQEK